MHTGHLDAGGEWSAGKSCRLTKGFLCHDDFESEDTSGSFSFERFGWVGPESESEDELSSHFRGLW